MQQLDAEAVQLHFWVQDTGIGMTREQVDRLFEPFTQADTSTTRQYGGTGLGLAICRKIIDAMDGTIAASNRPEGGSLFRISLPCRSTSETRPAELL